MTSASSTWKRELRIENDARRSLRQEIDPLIQHALLIRGFTEERTYDGQLFLDGSQVVPSEEYATSLGVTFDALRLKTKYDVSGEGKLFAGGHIHLLTIGGFASAQLVTSGARHYRSASIDKGTQTREKYQRVATAPFQSILEDVRAHTELGHSKSDELPSIETVFEDLETLNPNKTISRRAHIQLLTPDEHGDIQMNLGETFVERMHKSRLSRSRSAKMFEIIAKQPLGDGYLTTGLHYKSFGRNRTEMKLSTNISATDYTESECNELYDEAIRNFQDPRFNRFGEAVIRNVILASNPDADMVRVG